MFSDSTALTRYHPALGLPGFYDGLSSPHYHMHRPLWEEPEMNGARWPIDPFLGGCCEFCDAWEATPDVMDLLDAVSLYDPLRHADILQMYDNIHGHYRMGYDRDGSEAYWLSREVAKLAKMLNRDYRRNPWGERAFGDIASLLESMSSEILVGPKRRRYHCFPRPRYGDGIYYSRGGRRRSGRRGFPRW